jgi:hypothetical protein
MKSPAIIFSLFIIAAATIMVINKKTPPPSRRAITQKPISFEPGTPLTTVLFADSIQNMGKVKNGEKLTISFQFTNTGTEVLIIKEVAASCGCTVPEKPEAPIAPGKMGIIKATFDSKNREGMNHKVLSVYANTKQTKHDLVFDVEVIPAN